MFTTLLFWIIGLCIWSYSNVVINRYASDYYKNISWSDTRSICPHCQHTLSTKELIPLVSFLIQKGKCKHCHEKISLQYPLVELISTLWYIAISFLPSSLLVQILLAIVFSAGVILFMQDIKTMTIDIIVTTVFVIGSIIVSSLLFSLTTQQLIIHILIASGLFWAVVIATGGKWMGIGDPLLALAAAFLLGNIPHIILFLYLTFLLPFFLVLAKIIRYRSYQKIRKDSLPLGPYILIALALSFLNQYFSWIPVNDIWIAL